MNGVLPDSRLRDPKGTLMVDWDMPGGGHVRIEVEPVFCANCGKPHGLVPKENTTWAFWLCQDCFEEHGVPANLLVEPDRDFWDKVSGEMYDHYGHLLNQQELTQLAEQGWGPLAKLVKESPIKLGA